MYELCSVLCLEERTEENGVSEGGFGSMGTPRGIEEIECGLADETNKREISTVDGRLATELFEHFCCSCQSVTGFADRDIENQFINAEFPHGILGFVFAF